MKSILFSVFIIAMLFVGCKNEKSVDDLNVVKSEAVDNSFKVTVNVIAKKDDDFSLFYSEDGTTNFSAKPIWQKVKGNDVEQSLVYTLPEEVYPTELRLDFGLNKVQEDIVLKGLVLEYKGKTKLIAGPELGKYFRADQNKCTFDPATGVIKALVTNGERQGPSLYPHETVLKPEMEKLAK
ncbi:MAG: hypothetical protein CFE24_01060 [Flavobacterium sp. BFFFF2]|nr:MAG: hypothetical protein CFE24_01060 [Flavobacterium sp. BFFFF2]